MPPSSKAAAAAKDRRKSDKVDKAADKLVDNASPGLITLNVSPDRLRALLEPSQAATIKEDSPAKEINGSPATSTTLPAPASNLENASDSNPNTPAASGTPGPSQSAMGPPADGLKKKGVKRSAAAMNGNGDAVPKPRGKPGPKKKQRLEDGTLDPSRPSGLGAHKLGPKANQGAINAGLRALDRSGKPCRKWQKGGFRLKSFTGVIWEIPRWTAPPKLRPDDSTQDSTPASAEGSVKENNKENEQLKSDNSNSGGDVDMRSVPSINASSPAPIPVAAAS